MEPALPINWDKVKEILPLGMDFFSFVVLQ